MRRRCGVWLLGLLLWAAAAAVWAQTVPPQRIISLLPSATEAVCALGACDRLVGVDDFSLDPPQVQALPHLGRTWEPAIETVVQLRPDVVFTGRTPPVQQRLTALGLRVVEVDAITVGDVGIALERIGEVLQQQERARVLWAQLQQRLQQQAQALAQQRQGQAPLKVYVEVDGAMYAAGPQSFMGQVLAQLGAQNIVQTATPFPQLTPEFVVRADPDLIIQSHTASMRSLAQRPGWRHLRALQLGRVCQLDSADTRTVTHPGPHLDQAAAILARCLLLPTRQDISDETQ